MMRLQSRMRHVVCLVLLGLLPLSSCVHAFSHWETNEVQRSTSERTISVPVKAHLADGSSVIYANGVRVTAAQLLGTGVRTDVRGSSSYISAVPMDSIVGMESFAIKQDVVKSVLVTTAATAGAYVGTVLALVAIFGSCPTYYVDSAGTKVLQGEGFSYSIAPLFEQRDVDRLAALSVSDGQARVEIRNEALETHYLNHLELLAVEHDVGATVIADVRHIPLQLKSISRIRSATDRAGRDVSSVVAEGDGIVYSTAPGVLASAGEKDLDDFIDIEIDNPSSADSLAIHFRLRNSLLNTVLLYEGMLAGQGADAFQWLEDTQRITRAIRLGRWYSSRMGMRILVERGGELIPVSRLNDKGPIAFDDVGVVVPTFGQAAIRVRLTFPADNWRIDRIAAATFSRPTMQTIRLKRVSVDNGASDSAALIRLSHPDQQFLVTRPGQVFSAVFEVGAGRPGSTRTFMLASQGYYTEWMRRDWLKPGVATKPFQLNDASLASAIASWRQRQVAFEKQFYSSSIPVR